MSTDIMTRIQEMDTKELTRLLAALKVEGEQRKAIENAVKDRVLDMLGAGGRQYATTDSGEEIATVSVSKPKPTEAKPIVESPRELTAWLMEEEPEAVVMTPADWWIAALPQWIKAHDGELPPGVSLTEPAVKAPYVSVRISAKQRETVERILAPTTQALIEAGAAA